MRCTTEIQPREDRDTSSPILVRALRQHDLAASDVEKERLVLVRALKRNANSATEASVFVWSVLDFVLLHREQHAGIGLRQVDVRQNVSSDHSLNEFGKLTSL